MPNSHDPNPHAGVTEDIASMIASDLGDHRVKAEVVLRRGLADRIVAHALASRPASAVGEKIAQIAFDEQVAVFGEERAHWGLAHRIRDRVLALLSGERPEHAAAMRVEEKP